MFGGASASALPITLPILASDAWNWGYLAASFWENLRDLLRALFRVLVEDECAAVGRQGKSRSTSGVIIFSPCFSNCMSRTISGRSGPAECARVEQRKPGWNSSVMAAPPGCARRSSTSGLYPALAR